MHVNYHLKIVGLWSLLIILCNSYIFAQNQFNFEPKLPTENMMTAVDFFRATNKFQVTLSDKTDTEENQGGYIISRQIKVVKKDIDETPTFQITYISPDKVTGLFLPKDEVNFPVFSKPLQDRIFEFNCKDEQVVEVKNEGTTVVTGEAEFIKNECVELKRNTLKKSFFSGMKLGESKDYLTNTKPLLFFDNLDDLGIKKLTITLGELTGTAVKTAKFNISGKIDSNSSLGNTLQDCKGILVLDENGMSLELNLKCLSKEPSGAERESLKLPGGNEYKVTGETNITFLHKLF